MKTRFYAITSLYFIATGLFLFLIHDAYNSELNTYLNKKTNDLQIAYDKVVETYSISAKLLFDLEIDNPEIMSLISQTKNADSTGLTIIREELYNKLSHTYRDMSKYNYRQLHFHLSDNTSLLRFHRPEKFGDDLSIFRSTARNTNKYQTYSQGFEEGATLSAFRYVFPLLYKNEHYGSVELSVSYLGIISKIEENKDIACSFMISREVINSKIFKSEKNNYLTCNANKDFYVEKEGHDKIIKKQINGIEYPKIFKIFYQNAEA